MTRSIHSHQFAERIRRRVGVALVIAIAALVPRPLRAQAQEHDLTTAPADDRDVNPEARRLGERGLAHYEAGRYAEAIADFQASYKITPAPGLLYNLAQAYRLIGDCTAALTFYRRFLAEDPTGNIRQLTEKRIAETEPCATAKTAEAQPPPTLTPDLNPAASRSASGTLSLERTTEPVPAPGRDGVWRRWAGIGAGAVALGLAAAGAAYAWQAKQASDDVSAIYARGDYWGPDAMALERTGQDSEQRALWLGAGAVICAGISLWLLLLSK